MNKNDFINFIKVVEKLKTCTRHSWTSNKSRQESVAEHTWLVSLLALISISEIDNKEIDGLKLIKLSIIHDIAEAITGDIPTHEQDNIEKKYKDEKEAIERIVAFLPSKSAKVIRDLWNDYEDQKSLESRIVKALDKIEVGLQHNVADFSTWDENDKNYPFDYAEKYSKIEGFVDRLNKINIEWRKQKTASKT